jgi:hypothetical protein
MATNLAVVPISFLEMAINLLEIAITIAEIPDFLHGCPDLPRGNGNKPCGYSYNPRGNSDFPHGCPWFPHGNGSNPRGDSYNHHGNGHNEFKKRCYLYANLLLCPGIFFGRFTKFLFKTFAEIIYIGEPNHIGHLIYGVFVAGKKLGGAF